MADEAFVPGESVAVQRNAAQGSHSIRRQFHVGASLTATLTYYAAAGIQERHFHDEAHLSFLLAGEIHERLGKEQFELMGCAAAVKPAGTHHEDRWGPAGALVFNLKIGDRWNDAIPSQPFWSRVCDKHRLIRLIAILTRGEDPGEALDLLTDMVGLVGSPMPPMRDVPLWLKAGRDRIREEPEAAGIGQLSKEAGVHRTHYSRMFRRCFGVTASEYRYQARLAAAIKRLVEGRDNVAQVAAATGFYDQSHLSRTLRGSTSLPPRQLRSLLASGCVHTSPIPSA